MVSFDRIADIYDDTRPAPSPVVLDALAEELAGCRTVLDLGVGTGRVALPLRQRGFDVVGVDLSRKMLDVARAKGLSGLAVGDISCLPFRQKAFDAALAVHMLHLVRDWPALLSEVSRVAKEKLVTTSRTVEPLSASLWQVYYDALVQRGFQPAVGEHWESDLARLIPPRREVAILAYEEETRLDEQLLSLRRKESALTWDVPDALHEAVMRDLETRFGGKRQTFRYETHLMSWSADDFTEEALARAVGV
jgi:SAM-dependent methyltransferase